MKRLLAVLLLAAMLFSFAACQPADNTQKPDDKPDEPGQSSLFIDKIPASYDGAFVDRELVVTVDGNYEYELYAEEDSKETVDQLVYKRNAALQARFGVTIVSDPCTVTGAQDLTSHYNYVRDSLLRMEDNFDLIMLMAYQTGKLVTGGNYLDWRDGTYLPISAGSIKAGNEWWPENINRDCTVAGHQYLAVSDMCLTAMEMCYSVLYNKNLERDYNIARNTFGLNTLYEAVDAGRWTIDSLYSIVKDFYYDAADAGTTGAVDENDLFGIAVGGGTDTDAWAFACGFRYLNNDGENMPELWTVTGKTVQAISVLRSIYESKGAYGRTWGDNYIERTQFFVDGHALFNLSTLEQLKSDVFHEMESDYGVLPYPKYDELQKEYLTGTMDHWTCLSIPLFNIENLEMTDVLVEALSAESCNSVREAYYESILKYNSTRDSDSVRMIEKIMAGRVYDLTTYHYTELSTNNTDDGSLGLFFRRMLSAKHTTAPASQWNGSDRYVVEPKLQDLIDDYMYMFS